MEEAPNVVASQVRDLRTWRDQFLIEFNRRLEHLETKVEEVISGRPSWTVTIVITFLSSLCVGLAVKVFG